jgi:predicted nuclease of predicted toxin-antitoxin system
MQFLVDECVTPALVGVANEHGFVAYHVTHRGWPARADSFLLHRLLAEDLTIVTNNWKDFRPMLARAEVHPGAIVIPTVPRDRQKRLFDLVLRAINSADHPLDMVNTVVEIDASGVFEIYDLP